MKSQPAFWVRLPAYHLRKIRKASSKTVFGSFLFKGKNSDIVLADNQVSVFGRYPICEQHIDFYIPRRGMYIPWAGIYVPWRGIYVPARGT